ncbi:MAG: pilus assembly protein [Firmicutes bacterium]|nr:pilus assembly protein [Bacillota bacterium]
MRRGQAVVEFALLAPVVFLLLLGLLSLYLAVQARSTVADAEAAAVRWASTGQTTTIGPAVADALATGMGLHPEAIWVLVRQPDGTTAYEYTASGELVPTASRPDTCAAVTGGGEPVACVSVTETPPSAGSGAGATLVASGGMALRSQGSGQPERQVGAWQWSVTVFGRTLLHIGSLYPAALNSTSNSIVASLSWSDPHPEVILHGVHFQGPLTDEAGQATVTTTFAHYPLAGPTFGVLPATFTFHVGPETTPAP